MKDFAIRLKEARKSNGMSQRDVAMAVDITPSAYANYEQGLREPSMAILARICVVLDVSADYILGIEDWV